MKSLLNYQLFACFCVVSFVSNTYVRCYNIDVHYPIIHDFKHTKSVDQNSYFGFSLTLHPSWILVGAPRSNSSVMGESIMEPGAVYKCNIKGPCLEVALDRTKNVKVPGSEMWDLKNHSWIGVTMDYEEGEKGRFVVCGHRWKNQYESKLQKPNNRGYDMNGICYWKYTSSSDTDPAKLLMPTIKSSDWNFGNIYKYSLSQIGISLHLFPKTREEAGLLLGAPGILNWRGGVVEYESRPIQVGQPVRRRRSVVDSETFEELSILNTLDSAVGTSPFDLLGYQVLSGCFFTNRKRKCPYVAGAPKGADMKGYVIIYNIQTQRDTNGQKRQTFKLYDRKEGQEIGEYFGSSLAVADITGDNLDDLIVGAPMHSIKGDEGRIHVFIGSTTGQLLEPNNGKTISGKIINGRFGSSLASLGDIDEDGYEDIAVGAPYDGSGVIYIYNGCPEGLKDYSQSIRGEDIYKNLRGFGFSIARPTDIDGNKFKDIAVGSYISQHAVILRSYPVVVLKGTLSTSVTQIKLNDTSLKITACISYSGINAPREIVVLRTLSIDENYQRVKNMHKQQQLTIYYGKSNCEDLQFQLTTGDKLEDIRVILTQELVTMRNTTGVEIIWANGSSMAKENNTDIDKFCKFCPIVKQSYEDEIKIPYARECGHDGVCKSDLHLHCYFRHENKMERSYSEFIIGSSDVVQLTINVSNSGDNAYSSEVVILIPEELNLAQIPSICQERRYTKFLSVICNFDVVMNQRQKNISLGLDMSNTRKLIEIAQSNKFIYFNVLANSSSIELVESDNECKINLKPIIEADVGIVGKSLKYFYLYHRTDDKSVQKIMFTHIYEIQKVGASPISALNLTVRFPVVWHGSSEDKKFLELYQPQAYQNGQSLQCMSNLKYISTENSKNDAHEEFYTERVKRSVTIDPDNSSSSYIPPSNRTFYLNCSTPHVKCASIYCITQEFSISKTAKVSLDMILNVKYFEPLMKQKDIIYFSSEGKVEFPNLKYIPPSSKRQKHAVVSSPFIGTLQDERVEIWIIIVCIIAGILLILLIVMGLIKVGFFKRKMKEELQSLKHSENNAQ